MVVNSANGRWGYSTLLDYGIDVNLWKGGTFNVNAISNYMLHDEDYVSTDPIVFSNLDASPYLFRFSVLGLTQKIGKFTLFAGLRNSCPDYFADDELGYYIGSVHGIQLVLSNNFDVATYPTAALAFQVGWDITPELKLLTTFYNGKSGDKVKNEFHLGDGIKNITSLNYHTSARTIEVGGMMGKDIHDRNSFGSYLYGIERITDKLSLIGEFGYFFGPMINDEPNSAENCKVNAAIGGIYKFNDKNALGIAGTYTKFDEEIDDSQLEINYTRTIGKFSVSPILVLDNNNGSFQTIGVLRATMSLGN